MAGGQGVRMRPSTMVVPKPLAALGDQSVLEVIISQLSRWGFDNIITLLGYRADMIKSVIGDGSRWGVKIKCVTEEQPLGTIGGLGLVADALDENFLVLNADILTTLNYRRIFEYHTQGKNLATIGAVRRLEAIQLGVLEVNELSEICDFREKPLYHFLSTMGVHCFNRRILDFIPPGKPFGLDDLLFVLLQAKEKVQSFIFCGPWHDLGRPDDYEKAFYLFEKNPELFIPQKS